MEVHQVSQRQVAGGAGLCDLRDQPAAEGDGQQGHTEEDDEHGGSFKGWHHSFGEPHWVCSIIWARIITIWADCMDPFDVEVVLEQNCRQCGVVVAHGAAAVKHIISSRKRQQNAKITD